MQHDARIERTQVVDVARDDRAHAVLARAERHVRVDRIARPGPREQSPARARGGGVERDDEGVLALEQGSQQDLPAAVAPRLGERSRGDDDGLLARRDLAKQRPAPRGLEGDQRPGVEG